MKYSPEEVMQYAREEEVKFIRLAFCDIYGRAKNVSILAEELPRAFEYGIAFDASAIEGFGEEIHSDLFLHPDASTLSILPWRPEHGRVVRMFCDITYPDGTAFECDTRAILKRAVEKGKSMGVEFSFGTEMEFYLFKQDEYGEATKIPYDNAGYMDMAPEDKGENVRREICLTLEQMGIHPESSHHEGGPGQNEIDFRYSKALSAADNAQAFQNVVKTIAGRNGLTADFTPKPLADEAGSGMHINLSAQSREGENLQPFMIAGILKYISEITVFLNPEEASYSRFGSHKAPKYISWSRENRSQLIRVPAAIGEYRRVELRSPDCIANPYLAFALLIYACLEGIEQRMNPPECVDVNLFTAPKEVLSALEMLPQSLEEAKNIMKTSDFVRGLLPRRMIDLYSKKINGRNTAMDLKEKVYSVLLVSPSKNFLMTMNELFSEYPFSPVCAESSISKAKQRLLEKQFDFIIINLPPGAQGSFRFAIDVGRAKSNVVLMLIPREQYETAYEQVAEHGVYLLPKPTSKAMVVQALDWMLTTGERLKKMERKTLSVEEKMQEIRMINRAKWLLIEQMNMTEAEAHHYIEKQAMDRCVPRLKIAEEIISG